MLGIEKGEESSVMGGRVSWKQCTAWSLPTKEIVVGRIVYVSWYNFTAVALCAVQIPSKPTTLHCIDGHFRAACGVKHTTTHPLIGLTMGILRRTLLGMKDFSVRFPMNSPIHGGPLTSINQNQYTPWSLPTEEIVVVCTLSLLIQLHCKVQTKLVYSVILTTEEIT